MTFFVYFYILLRLLILTYYMKLLVYLFSTFKSLELVNKSKVDKIFESKLKLNPNFITGLTESEGSFSIIKHKDIRAKFKINISLRFKITMLNNEVELLNMIKYFLNGYFINVFIVGDGFLALSLKNKNFGRMSLQITQHINNKLLLVSIANYFKSLSKVYPHGPKSLQLTLSGIKVWENVVFNHFCLYPLYGSKS